MLQIGEIYETELLVDYDEQVAFCDIIGDLNKLHRKYENARVLINGMYSVCLVGGILSKLYPESINIQRSAKFIRPIYLDESYKVIVKLCDMVKDMGIGIVRAQVKDAKNRICLTVDTQIKNREYFS
ncbi:hypothetical protein [Bacteroides sp.]|jgi:hypothetical protein|uniref:hypothetical protein n=1 Tax=Bacteroides sp. TaxID=29523 RepID=UPI0025C5913D|nr:hypothetical protein [Bacteroides sp.]